MPSRSARVIKWTRVSVRRISSTAAPVPSGELSSTTTTSRSESCASTAGTMRVMLSCSLNVGMTTTLRDMRGTGGVRSHRASFNRGPPILQGKRSFRDADLEDDVVHYRAPYWTRVDPPHGGAPPRARGSRRQRDLQLARRVNEPLIIA